MFPTSTSHDFEELLTDDDLKRSAANKNHRRAQQLQDHLNNVCIVAMYLLPLSFLFIGMVLVFHWIHTQQWAALEKLGLGIMTYVGGYFTKHLQSGGIKKD